MKPLCIALALLMLPPTLTETAASDGKLYELRIYTAPPGKLDALHARFRNHTLKLFEKHGMTNVGYWVPLDNSAGQLYYVLAYPDAPAREAAWKAFLADPDWKKVQSESEKDGKLVAKVESILLKLTDYSPVVKPGDGTPRVFELRTYTLTPGNLPNINARFRDHTMKLFAKHGMTNLWYWNLLPGQKGADTTLIYFLAHKSPEAAKASFAAFRADPEWIKARTESEAKAGGSLTTKDGVQSLFLQATDYSPFR